MYVLHTHVPQIEVAHGLGSLGSLGALAWAPSVLSVPSVPSVPERKSSGPSDPSVPDHFWVWLKDPVFHRNEKEHYPPTPVLAMAGAAPGTTFGVDLGFSRSTP